MSFYPSPSETTAYRLGQSAAAIEALQISESS